MIESIITSDTIIDSATEVRQFIHYSIWFWMSLLQFMVIVLLSYKLLKLKPVKYVAEISKTTIKESAKEEFNMNGLIDSINKSGKLFKELSSKCHPDRFVNNPKQKTAEDIFQEITRYRRNFDKLIALKERAVNELNVKF